MSQYDSKIWTFLYALIGNSIGVAALMGNLYAESGLYPNRLQGTQPNDNETIAYTANVDNGVISEYDFIHNGPNGGGYGLAQWTWWERKQNFYEMYKTRDCSIGDIDLQLDFLSWELQNYFNPSLLNTLKTATNLFDCSTVVLFDFENPADKSEAVQELRASYGQGYYNTYAGGVIVPPDPPDPPTENSIYDLLLTTSYKIGQLSREQILILQSLQVGSKCILIPTFNHNKRQVGRNFLGKKLTFDTLRYTIKNVENDGFLSLYFQSTTFIKRVNPKYVKGVEDDEN